MLWHHSTGAVWGEAKSCTEQIALLALHFPSKKYSSRLCVGACLFAALVKPDDRPRAESQQQQQAALSVLQNDGTAAAGGPALEAARQAAREKRHGELCSYIYC